MIKSTFRLINEIFCEESTSVRSHQPINNPLLDIDLSLIHILSWMNAHHHHSNLFIFGLFTRRALLHVVNILHTNILTRKIRKIILQNDMAGNSKKPVCTILNAGRTSPVI